MLDDVFEEPGRWLVLLGIVCGVLGGLFMGYLRFRLNDEPWHDSALPHLAFGLVYVAPFLFALAAFLIRDQTWRGMLWAGAGILGLLTVLTAMSGVSFVMAPGGALLLYGGMQEMGVIPDWRAASLSVLPAILAGAVVVVGVASFLLLFRTTDPVCWQRTIVDGQPTWQVPATTMSSQMIMSEGMRCASDHITVDEARSSIAVWTVGGTLILLSAMLGSTYHRLPAHQLPD